MIVIKVVRVREADGPSEGARRVPVVSIVVSVQFVVWYNGGGAVGF